MPRVEPRGRVEVCPYRAFGTPDYAKPARFECRDVSRTALLPSSKLRAALAEALRLMRNRTLWLVGDSVTMQTYVALKCALYAAGALIRSSPLPKAIAKHEVSPEGAAGCFIALLDHVSRGTTPPQFCVLQSRFAKGGGAATGSLRNVTPAVVALLGDPESESAQRGVAQPADLVLLNLGLFYTGPLIDEGRARAAVWANLISRLRVAEAARGSSLPAVAWRESTPQHFPTTDGVFDRESLANGSAAQSNTAGANGCRSIVPSDSSRAAELQSNALNEALNPVMRAHNISVLEVWHAGATHGDEHVGTGLHRWAGMAAAAVPKTAYSARSPPPPGSKIDSKLLAGDNPQVSAGVDCSHWCEPSSYLSIVLVTKIVGLVKQTFGSEY